MGGKHTSCRKIVSLESSTCQYHMWWVSNMAGFAREGLHSSQESGFSRPYQKKYHIYYQEGHTVGPRLGPRSWPHHTKVVIIGNPKMKTFSSTMHHLFSWVCQKMASILQLACLLLQKPYFLLFPDLVCHHIHNHGAKPTIDQDLFCHPVKTII